MSALLAQVAQPGTLSGPDVDWAALSPLMIMAVGGALLLTFSSLIKPMPKHVYAFVTAGLALAAFIATIVLWRDHEVASYTLGGAVSVDLFTLFCTGIITASVFLTALLADDYLRREGIDGPELYVLMLLSASGGVVMAMANDLIVLFLGLEILSIAVYVMAAMHLRRSESQESGLKYFLLGGFSSAFFLYGIAFLYGATGTTRLSEMTSFLEASFILRGDAYLLIGFGLMLVGLAFKVAAVPFHAWTPDVYDGAPSPVVAYMASGVKVAGFAAILRAFPVAFGSFIDDWQPVLIALAVASIVVGSLLAVVQTNVKRMLAYSSISHAGFIMIGVQVGADGMSAALFYLFAYTFMVVGSFAVVTLAGGQGDGAHELDDYKGLARRRPALAFALAVFLFAQAGVPFTTGFVAKLGVIFAAADGDQIWLAIVAMVAAVVAAFLYLRIVVSMFLAEETEEELAAERAPIDIPAGAAVAIAVAFAVTVGFGIFPGVIDDLARDALPLVLAG